MKKEENNSTIVNLATILVVDDDNDIRTLLSELLKKNEFNTLIAKNGTEMVDHLNNINNVNIDLIILDVMMPGEDGLSLLKRLPVIVNNPPPVLMLSAKGEDVDRIIGLEMGSDDYLVKPFHPRELIARIKSVLRRHQQNNPTDKNQLDLVKFGHWLFDRSRRLLFKIDTDINVKTQKKEIDEILKTSGEGLNTIEYRLLTALTDNPQRVLSRDFLLDATIGREHIPTDRTIDVQMSRLRQRLGDDARHSELIKTVRYEGYMLTVATEKIC